MKGMDFLKNRAKKIEQIFQKAVTCNALKDFAEDSRADFLENHSGTLCTVGSADILNTKISQPLLRKFGYTHRI